MQDNTLASGIANGSPLQWEREWALLLCCLPHSLPVFGLRELQLLSCCSSSSRPFLTGPPPASDPCCCCSSRPFLTDPEEGSTYCLRSPAVLVSSASCWQLHLMLSSLRTVLCRAESVRSFLPLLILDSNRSLCLEPLAHLCQFRGFRRGQVLTPILGF